MKTIRVLPLLAVSCLLFTERSLGGSVLVVSAGGGSAHSQIQPAIDAAAEGDTILIKAGSYQPFTLSKSLHLLAEPSLQATITGTVSVRNLPASSKPAVLTGLKIAGKPALPVSESGLVMASNAASVHLERCWILGGASKEKPSGNMGIAGNGIEISQNAAVLIALCTIDGGVGRDVTEPDIYRDGGQGAHGIVSRGSLVALYHSSLRGGNGGEGAVEGGDAGSGYLLLEGTLYAFGNSFLGGKGGNSTSFDISIDGGNGGHGLWTAIGSSAEMRGNTLSGQPGGWSIGGFSGANGAPIFGAGTVTQYPGIAPKLVSNPHPLRDDQTATFTVTGTPGHQVMLSLSRKSEFDWNPFLLGLQVPKLSALRLVAVGTIPSNGILDFSLFLPDSMAPALAAAPFFVQATVTDPGNAESSLTTPLSLSVLDHNLP